jgi:hypothetical protein
VWHSRQGDQIGQIFASRVVVYFGQFVVNYRRSANYKATFFYSTRYVLILTKHGLGYILGDFLQTHLVTLTLGKVMATKRLVALK